jgi:hypothetical protein
MTNIVETTNDVTLLVGHLHSTSGYVSKINEYLRDKYTFEELSSKMVEWIEINISYHRYYTLVSDQYYTPVSDNELHNFLLASLLYSLRTGWSTYYRKLFPETAKFTEKTYQFSWPTLESRDMIDPLIKHSSNKETIMTSTKFFQRKALINDTQAVDDMDAKQILAIIGIKESEINQMKQTKAQPTILKNAIAAAEAELAEFIAYLEEKI